MLGETLTLSIDGTNKVLSRINEENFSATYLLLTPTEEFTVVIKHAKDKPRMGEMPRDRHNVRLVHTVFAVAPALPVVREISTTIVGPRADDKTALAKEVVGMGAYLSLATTTKILGWES